MFAVSIHPALVAVLSFPDVPSPVLRAAAVLLLVELAVLLYRVYRKSPPDTITPMPSIPPKATRKALHRRSSTLPLLSDTWDAVAMDPSTLLTWNIHAECARVGYEPLLFRVVSRPDMVVVSDPRAVEDVLKTHFYNFERRVRETFFDLIGDSLLGADGETWLMQRRVFAKLFTPRMLRGTGADGDDGVLPIIHRHAAALHRSLQRHECANAAAAGLEATQEKSVVNLTALSSTFAVEVAAEIGFGVTMEFLDATVDGQHAAEQEEPDRGELREFMAALKRVESVIGRRLMLPSWLWKLQRALGLGPEGEIPRHLVRIDRVAMALIHHSLVANKASGAAKRKNLVSVFMDEMYADPDKELSDRGSTEFLRDIAISFLIAAHDSSAQTLSWVLYSIATHPDVEARVVEELSQHWPLRRAAEQPAEPFLPSEEQLQQLVYLEATIRETMRLYPVVAFNMRTCVKNTLLSDGTFVAQGSRVGLPTFAMGRSEKIWGDDAHEFRPERWLEEDSGTVRVKQVTAFQYPVFHAGPRECLGRHLAMVEMKAVTATVVASFRLVVSPKNHEAKYVAWLVSPTHETFYMRVLPRVVETQH